MSSPQVPASGTGAGPRGHHIRRRNFLPTFAFLAAAALMLVLTIAPDRTPPVNAEPAAFAPGEVQTLSVSADLAVDITRDSYKVTKKVVVVAPKPASGAPAVGVPDPGTAQAIGYELVHARGWGDDQYACLVSLFNKESHWNVYASNPSGAYGIPQALPGSKMATAGADWATNPRTQITWGLNYIQGRYLTPCGAWGHSQSSGWY
ncbi:transglycosylase SLT domain-containing protein [Lacisediminihabitans sp.]|uniref:aggregation-promoting factor C-terminal-like domain-containing protein n=1 Tax=Lacisediminihabitans sp. TaxID=2787631 RepID=UPI00374C9046